MQNKVQEWLLRTMNSISSPQPPLGPGWGDGESTTLVRQSHVETAGNGRMDVGKIKERCTIILPQKRVSLPNPTKTARP